jgi:tRNA pseudouridine38-40 synthase
LQSQPPVSTVSQRMALGLSYSGQAYEGWQSQLSGQTVQDQLEKALSEFTQAPIRTHCAGRTDSGVHAVMQVVHFDSPVVRENNSWVRGTNRYLPKDIAIQWARVVPENFHARACAHSRKYAYLLSDSPVRPSLSYQRVGWIHKTLALEPMQKACEYLLGEHDFTSFRAAQCQALSPIKHIEHARVVRLAASPAWQAVQAQGGSKDDSPHVPTDSTHPHAPAVLHPSGGYLRFEVQANAFLHHMVRNIMGCLVQVGLGERTPEWVAQVIQAKDRRVSAPTFPADGLYFLGPVYDPIWNLPIARERYDWGVVGL